MDKCTHFGAFLLCWALLNQGCDGFFQGPDAVEHGVSSPGGTCGATGASLLLDGVDDFVRLEPVSGLDGDGITVDAWLRPLPSAHVQKHDILARRSPAGHADSFTFRLRADMGRRLELGLANLQGEWGCTSMGALSWDGWSHVAFTHDRLSRTVTFYLDGQWDSQHQATISPGMGDLPLWLGGDPLHGPTARPFHGWLDQVRVWGRVLDPSEVLSASRTGAPVSQEALLVRLSLDEGSGQRVGSCPGDLGAGVLGNGTGEDESDPRWSDDAPSPW